MLTPMRGALFISTVELTCAGPGVPPPVGVEVGVALAVRVAVLVGVPLPPPTPVAVGVGVAVALKPEVGVAVGVNVGTPAPGRYAINALAHVVELFVVHPVHVDDEPPGSRSHSTGGVESRRPAGIQQRLSRVAVHRPVHKMLGPRRSMPAAEPKTISFGSEEVPNEGVFTVAAKGLIE